VRRNGSGDQPIPFREWLGTACAVLGWRPCDFWECSLVEFFAVIEAWNKAQRQASGKPEPLTQEDADEIFAAEERFAARLRAQLEKASNG
jgi:hypothetical protein